MQGGVSLSIKKLSSGSDGAVSVATIRLCKHEVVSEHFHNSQNNNDENYENSHRIRVLVLVLKRCLFCFS